MKPRDTHRRLILLILLLGFIQGLIFSGVTPPWQSPDEPRHFEYIKWLYEKEQPSSASDPIPGIEREILLSMYQFDFWNYVHRPTPPAIPASFADAPFLSSAYSLIGYQPPLYYDLGVMVYRMVLGRDLVTQLLALRAFSALLGTMVVLFAYLLSRELLPNSRFVVIGVPAFIALSPMFWFIAGCVNNDVLATSVTSALIYALVRTLRRGFSIRTGVLIVVLALLAVLSKRTSLIGLPLILTTIPLYIWAKKISIPRNWMLGILATVSIVLLVGWQVIGLRGNNPDGWQELPSNWMDSRSSTYSRSGGFSIHLRKDSPDHWQYIAQFLPPKEVEQLKGKTVTLRVWARGAAENEAAFIMLSDGVASKDVSFRVGTEWKPVELSYEISQRASLLRIALGPGIAIPQGTGDVYFDDVSLSEGTTEKGTSPNLVYNGSAEAASWRWEGSEPVKYLGAALAGWSALVEGKGLSPEIAASYWVDLRTAFESFWGVFGWMAAPLGQEWYLAALLFTLISFAGLMRGTVQKLRVPESAVDYQKAGVLLLLIAVLFGVAMILITYNPAVVSNSLPQGRYLLPIIVPGTILFVLGLCKVIPAKRQELMLFCCISGFFLFSSAILLTHVVPFFYGL